MKISPWLWKYLAKQTIIKYIAHASRERSLCCKLYLSSVIIALDPAHECVLTAGLRNYCPIDTTQMSIAVNCYGIDCFSASVVVRLSKIPSCRVTFISWAIKSSAYVKFSMGFFNLDAQSVIRPACAKRWLHFPCFHNY